MPPVRIKAKDIARIKAALLKKQGGLCLLCRIDLTQREPKDVVLDHCHKSGYIRGVICRNCNGIEGKVYNLANRAKRGMTPSDWLKRLIAYWLYYSEPRTEWLHPTHKTEREKQDERNEAAKKRRALKKASKGSKEVELD